MQNTHGKDEDYFNIEVFGDYFTSTAQGNVVRPFGPVFLKMRRYESCQSLARFHLLPKLIGDVDPEFKQMRRCIVLGVKTHDFKPVHRLPMKLMSRDQIALECRSQHIPLRVDMYNDILELRNKYRMAVNDPDRFKKEEQKHIRAFDKLGDAFTLNAKTFDDIKAQSDKAADKALLDKNSKREQYGGAQETQQAIDDAKALNAVRRDDLMGDEGDTPSGNSDDIENLDVDINSTDDEDYDI